MKKVVFLLSFLAFVLADENDWLNQWTSPSTAPKATQSGVKSVAYYKQNKSEAERVLQECVTKMMKLTEQATKGMTIEQLNRNWATEADFEKWLVKKLGRAFMENCENAENALK